MRNPKESNPILFGLSIQSFLRPLLNTTRAEIPVLTGTTRAETGLLFDNVPIFNSHQELFASSAAAQCSWALIGSRNCLHKEHCLVAFTHGMHVFCEKPLATTIEDCEAIRKAHTKSGKLFCTGFVLRHAPFYKKVKEIVSSGALGKIISIEANETLPPPHGGYIMRNWRRHRNETGPHMLEKCCHDVDILNWIIDSLPSRVASFGGLDVFLPENKPPPRVGRFYRGWAVWEDVDPFDSDKDTEDNQVVIMEYRNRVRVTFHTNCNSMLPERSLKIFGLKGTLHGDLLKGKLCYSTIEPESQDQVFRFNSRDTHGGADEIIMEDLVSCMDKETQPQASGEEGFRSAISCLAIDRARIEGTVVDLEPMWEIFGM